MHFLAKVFFLKTQNFACFPKHCKNVLKKLHLLTYQNHKCASEVHTRFMYTKKTQVYVNLNTKLELNIKNA